VLKTHSVRQLNARDTTAVLRALDRDPVASCMVAARVQAHGVDPNRLQGELLTQGRVEESLCFSGANLVPLSGSPQAVRAFSERVRRRPRSCSSLVGPADLVMAMWSELEGTWGAARDVRPEQPLLALTGALRHAPDPLVRPVQMHELDVYLPAAVAMFTEEVGVDPRGSDGGRSYRHRVADLIAGGRAWARFEHGEVVFKAEIGSVSALAGQIQGVWVHPEWRGRGLGAAGTAAVAAGVQAGGRVPSLYVNDFNAPARAAYRRVGFTQVGTFATVLLH
jgi:predicted GNAT family acetyltransferase